MLMNTSCISNFNPIIWYTLFLNMPFCIMSTFIYGTLSLFWSTLVYFYWSKNVNAWLYLVTDLGLFCETALYSFIVSSQQIKQICYTVPTSVLYSVKMSVICLTAAIRKEDLPLVKVQQLSRFLAFGLGLHNIPVLLIHTPPCGWILTGKQSTHGSRELTASPANTQNKVCTASIVLKPHCAVLFSTLLRFSPTNTAPTFVWRTPGTKLYHQEAENDSHTESIAVVWRYFR